MRMPLLLDLILVKLAHLDLFEVPRNNILPCGCYNRILLLILSYIESARREHISFNTNELHLLRTCLAGVNEISPM